MKYKAQVQVLGMKASKGVMDNGTKFDSTKAYLVVDMDTSKDNALGQAAGEFALGDSTVLDRFRSMSFPFHANGEFEMVTNGKATKTVCLGLTPISPAKA